MRAIRTSIAILAIGLLSSSAVTVAAQGTAVRGTHDATCTLDADRSAEAAIWNCTGTFVLDDPRLSGPYESTMAEIRRDEGDGFESGVVRQEVIRITNEVGAWSGEALYGAVGYDRSLPQEGREFVTFAWVLTGEGGYHGLAAFLGGEGGEGLKGVIVEGTLPELPDDDLRAAWDAVHDNTPAGWYVGRPGYEERYRQWSMHAFDPTEKPVVGKRSREWVAVGQTELHCVQEMARCLGELKAGRWPR